MKSSTHALDIDSLMISSFDEVYSSLPYNSFSFVFYAKPSYSFSINFFFIYLQVTWIRHRDLHLLTVDKTTYTSDQRFVSVHNPQMGDWSLQVNFSSVIFTSWFLQINLLHLQVRYPQRRDSGVYECQVSTTPPVANSMILSVVGKFRFRRLNFLLIS